MELIKISPLILLLCFQVALGSQTEPKISFCKSEVTRFLKETAPQPQWRKVLAAQSETAAYRTPLGDIGEWIEIQIGSNIEVTQIKNGDFRTVTWSKENCKPKESPYAKFRAFSDSSQQDLFSDSQLKNLLKSKKSYLIYLWSPGMLYSAKYHNDFSQAAKKLGLSFVSVADNNYPQIAIDGAKKKNNIKIKTYTLNSIDLLMREATSHYPMSYLIQNGKLSRFPVIGVYSEGLEGRLRQELANLAGTASKPE